MTTINRVHAREILDCRLEPTLRVTVETEGASGQADVPCGRSRGKHEAVDLRDGGDRYAGRGVQTAVENVNERIAPQLVGREVLAQRAIDEVLLELDGTDQKSNLGGNATTGVSLAVAKCAANSRELPLYRYLGDVGAHTLPVPFFDLIEGGELAAGTLDFQEHQVVPTGAESFSQAIQMCAEVYYELGDQLARDYGDRSRNVGVEGGYTPGGMNDPRDAFEAELQAIEELGYGDEFVLAADVAASHFYDENSGTYALMDEQYTRGELLDFYAELTETYPVVSLEDPLEEDDFEGYRELADTLDIQIIGDDLFVTNPKRLQRGIDEGAANALLLKVNQVGTLSEALDAASLAVENGYAVQVSERSGQTPDTWLADLAVGLDAGQIKTGVSRGERTEQYNRLLEIEAEQERTAYAGPFWD
ncbi:phosphopyruvate hydratase [Haladaptatus sp. DYSN1]|uniref:phosphopyruvate hydratase n=1 Tax=unclassified Haladaptatus TaxID=2622732 RepID=UPI002407544E|nr:phosphopyruvate hydratase [Haladaptatus sp. DYSN1]